MFSFFCWSLQCSSSLSTPISQLHSQISHGEKTIADRVSEFGGTVHARLQPSFHEIGIGCPPKKLLLVGLKQERQLEIWVSDGSPDFRFLKAYPVLAASGTLGPKLKEGDRQVPEGLYKIESLNPN